MEQVKLASEQLNVVIAAQGAELQSLKQADGTELLWQADPQVWPRHAPHLFPIVGRLKDDQLVVRGKRYPMSQHGFARDQLFTVGEGDSTRRLFELRDNPDTRVRFPYAFIFRVEYELRGNSLEIGYVIQNPSADPLPVSVGAHPAFVWPLRPGLPKTQHAIVFEQAENMPVRRLDTGLLKTQTFPAPIDGHALLLKDELFEDDALIFDRHTSRRVTYTAPEAPRISLEFDDFPHLGIWTKPGADFICIEPWQGHADPVDFNGEFTDKPGIVAIAAGAQRRWRYRIVVE